MKIAIFQVFLSKLPWHKMFYKMLNHAAELITYHSQDSLFRFLHVSSILIISGSFFRNTFSLQFQASHTAKVPEFGHSLHISWLTDSNEQADEVFPTPHPLNLPSIPESVS